MTTSHAKWLLTFTDAEQEALATVLNYDNCLAIHYATGSDDLTIDALWRMREHVDRWAPLDELVLRVLDRVAWDSGACEGQTLE
jgi:hypothetical protein